MSKIPVTVLTGFLGSGKTTLLNRILSEHHGKRIAVIENEFGEIGIDHELVVNADEEVFEMNNGCICCTVRGDLIRVLGNLMRRRDKFDHILVETTGMANPGPVAQTFFADPEMQELFELDAIVTLVDAKHVLLHLDDASECKEQIAFADVLVLNKTDLVSDAELETLERRIRGINSYTQILRAQQANVPIASVLDIGAFDLARTLAVRPTFLEPEYPFEWAGTFDLQAGEYELHLDEGPDPSMTIAALALKPSEVGHDVPSLERAIRLFSAETTSLSDGGTWPLEAGLPIELLLPKAARFVVTVSVSGRFGIYSQHHPTEFALRLSHGGESIEPAAECTFEAGHTHDEEVTSVGIRSEAPLDEARVNAWLSKLLREQGADIFRMKGILNIQGNEQRFVFQGVHMLLDARADRFWGTTPRLTELVFIGRNLDRAALKTEFDRCLA